MQRDDDYLDNRTAEQKEADSLLNDDAASLNSRNDDGDDSEDDDDDLSGRAEAAAQVAVMGNAAELTTMEDVVQNQRRGRGRGGNDQEIFNAEGDQPFDLFDEGAELVKARFLEFLQIYTEQIHEDQKQQCMYYPNLEQFCVQVDDDTNGGKEEGLYYFPYLYQAHCIAEYLTRLADHHQNGTADDDNHPQSQQRTTLFVDCQHVASFDDELSEAIECDIERFEPYLRRALQQCLTRNYPQIASLLLSSSLSTTAADANSNRPNNNQQQKQEPSSSQPFLAVSFYNHPKVSAVRELRMEHIGRLLSFSGTITRTSEVRPELISATFRCQQCGLLSPNIKQEYHFCKPALCRNPRCDNTSSTSWILEATASQFVDWQKLRVQENADEIPPGSLPRSLDVIIRNDFVETTKAGDKCIFTGTLVVVPDQHALSRTGEPVMSQRALLDNTGGVRGLKALGVRELTYRTCFVAYSAIPTNVVAMCSSNPHVFQPQILDTILKMCLTDTTHHEFKSPREIAMEMTQEERDQIRTMKNTPQLYKKMAQSIAPSVFGHEELKRGVLLMLLGGVHKVTSEGMRLRGDINVCIIGDPSTAKSSFLKYVHSFDSRTVYTSGKASSAAGLTASVMRDQDTGEFCIEAGALMLADHGFCCIDEFDKMDLTDQVAIHEAMEQQTISITKAGIQATLNARASILAAANPIYGRYDRSKTLKANVALSAPILSRFDLFFVVLDECDELADYNVAKHILDVHRCIEEAVQPPFTKQQLQRYIRFARTINPVITPESHRVMVECYRGLRQGDSLGRGRTAYRITVRQLESLVRLSEALARLHLDDEVKPVYVREACRLLRKSIIHVETEDVTFDDEFLQEDMIESAMEEEGVHELPNEHIEDPQMIEEKQDEMEVGYNVDDSEPPEEAKDDRKTKGKQKKVKKSKITFEEYERIANSLAVYLRAKEEENPEKPVYLTWNEAVEWYLSQIQGEIGDSIEELNRMKKLTNLVVRRLIEKDRVLVFIGEFDGPEKERLIATHPNYSI